MANNHLETEIRTCINAFVEELSKLVKQAAIESVQEALGGSSAPARRGPGRPRKAAAVISRPSSKRRKRRSSDAVDTVAIRILEQVKANPGQGVGEIGSALRLTSKELRLPILKLLGDKKLKTKGQRRGTKYFIAGATTPKATKASGKRAAGKAKTKAKKARKRVKVKA